MKYDDFPILDDMTYKIMQEQYNKTESYQQDKYELIGTVFNSLSALINCDISNAYQFKKSIVLSLNNSKNEINNIYQTLLKTFNINNIQNNLVKSLNLFSYLSKLLSLYTDIYKLENVQEKTYYKQILSKSKDSILESIAQILSTLETSTVHFFKHI